jgi:hypothetical protein
MRPPVTRSEGISRELRGLFSPGKSESEERQRDSSGQPCQEDWSLVMYVQRGEIGGNIEFEMENISQMP